MKTKSNNCLDTFLNVGSTRVCNDVYNFLQTMCRRHNKISSAYIKTSTLITPKLQPSFNTYITSFINKKKSNGPRIQPCFNPTPVSKHSVTLSLNQILAFVPLFSCFKAPIMCEEILKRNSS